jgi:hypothetical protein
MIPWPISPLPDLAECRKVARWRNHGNQRRKWGDKWSTWVPVGDEQLFRLIACTVLHRSIPFTGPGLTGSSWMGSAQSFAAGYRANGVQTYRGGALGDALLWWLLLAAAVGDDLGMVGVPFCNPSGGTTAWPAGDIWDWFSISWQSSTVVPKPFGPLNSAAWLAAGYGSGYPPQTRETVSGSVVIAGMRDGTGVFAPLASATIPFAFYATSEEVGSGGLPTY